jgi:hypothetical protein
VCLPGECAGGLGRELGLTEEDVEALESMREGTPAEPLNRVRGSALIMPDTDVRFRGDGHAGKEISAFAFCV